jgi:hypothetical protein
MRVVTAVLCLCLQATWASAEDLSPWFGSADQKPFRIDVTETGATPAEQTATNSTEPADCKIAGCPNDVKTVNATEGQAGLSQN